MEVTTGSTNPSAERDLIRSTESLVAPIEKSRIALGQQTSGDTVATANTDATGPLSNDDMAEPPSERTKVHTQNKTGGEEHPSEDNSAALLAPVVKNSVSQSGIAVDISAQPKPQAEKSVSGESDKKSPQDTITEISAQENLVPRLDSGGNSKDNLSHSEKTEQPSTMPKWGNFWKK